MPTWKSPLSAASLPSSTRSWSRGDGGDLAGHVGRAEGLRVGDDVDRRGAADGERGAQLLDRVGVTEGEHGRRTAGRGGDLHRELDRALLVGAHREAGVPAVDGLAVLGQHDLARRVDDPLDADEDARHRMRSLAGSRRAVASTEPTVTG